MIPRSGMKGTPMRRFSRLLPLLVMLLACNTGCRRRASDLSADAASHKPGTETSQQDDRAGFDLGPSASDARFTERDIPLAERPADLSAFRDPFADGGDGNDSGAGKDVEWSTVLRDLHFEFDSFELPGSAQATLSEIGSSLRMHPDVSIVVEGHCDERGASSYNLALGERRALAVREFLVAMGIPSERIHTVSYGEEYPLAPGHDETSWARNRRAHFRIKDE